jgi:hypothetical protein
MNRAPAIISQPALALEMIIHFGRAGLGCRSACLRHPRQFYEDEVQDDGSLTQTVTLLQPLANSLPMFVFLMATQKTKATKTTIKVYSTKPWPSSSTNKRFKRSINDFTSFRQKWPCVHRESSLSIVCAPRSREALGELLRLLGMAAAR